MVTVRGPSVLLFVVEVLKVEPGPAPTLHHGTEDWTVLERELKLETVIRILAMVRDHTATFDIYRLSFSVSDSTLEL